MSQPLQPGDVVVCVDISPNEFGGVPLGLEMRRIYRIEDAFVDPSTQLPVVLLVGWRSLDHTGAYLAYRFRKIDDEVTEEFREQLAKLPARELVQ